MKSQISNILALIDAPIQTTILKSLLDGRSYTAIELATTTDTSVLNMKAHLTKLINADLIAVENQGRHIYYRLSGKEVADAIENLTNYLPSESKRKLKTITT